MPLPGYRDPLGRGPKQCPMSDAPKTHTTCRSCGSDQILSISMSLEERTVVFTTCHACEAKWWEQAGSRIPLRSVLSLVPRR